MKNTNKNINGIFINQIGYLPADSKIAFITEKAKGNSDTFELCDFASSQTVYTGKICAKNNDGSKYVDSTVGEEIFYADFSDFTDEGKYFVKINDANSFSFEIKKNVYQNLLDLTLKYFTLSRCGQGICHTADAEIYGTHQTKKVQGGWHDAGDYGRYIVATAKTVMDLLLAYENITEKTAVSDSADCFDFDILGEVRYALEWMLQMQREDGAVYHKISCYHFCGFINPEDEKDKVVLAPVSTTATADFAGSLAYASRFYTEKDKTFADSLLNAALKAQDYLNSHDDELFINPPEITTGAYGDPHVQDERYFALCSLWLATQNPLYLKNAFEIRTTEMSYVASQKNDINKQHFWYDGFGWGLMSGFGDEILIKNSEKIPQEFMQNEQDIKNCIIKEADEIVQISNNSAFKYNSTFYGWGSNGAICDKAHILILANSIMPKKEYLTVAKAQADYILGCNPLNYCYVTGAGSKSPEHPHHRPSGASKKVMPGMLVGGPCASLQDEYARKHLAGEPPLKCYADAEPSYSTNEVAIYWNSALIYVLSMVG